SAISRPRFSSIDAGTIDRIIAARPEPIPGCPGGESKPRDPRMASPAPRSPPLRPRDAPTLTGEPCAGSPHARSKRVYLLWPKRRGEGTARDEGAEDDLARGRAGLRGAAAGDRGRARRGARVGGPGPARL